MGTVIDLSAWREHARRPSGEAHDPIGRLERIVNRLDPLLEEVKRERKRDLDVETEILAITGALSLGMQEEAAERAERLASRLEAKAGGGSGT
jgi:hypothetical protein